MVRTLRELDDPLGSYLRVTGRETTLLAQMLVDGRNIGTGLAVGGIESGVTVPNRRRPPKVVAPKPASTFKSLAASCSAVRPTASSNVPA